MGGYIWRCRLTQSRSMTWTNLTPEAMTEFRDKLLDTLDEMETFEPDIDEEEEEYYEWEGRINILHDLIDEIDAQLEDRCVYEKRQPCISQSCPFFIRLRIVPAGPV